MITLPTIRFRNDKELRDKLYTSEAYAHPAKGNLHMWMEMIQSYSRPGDVILDPMAGIGTSLVGALMGRHVCCLELEQHFIEPMRASWEKMRQHPMLGCEMGEVLILRADARAMPIASADAVITSPPFEDQPILHDMEFTPPHQSKPNKELYSRYSRPAVIITSPPYEGTEVAQSSDGDANRRFRIGGYTGDAVKGMGLSRGYSRPSAESAHNVGDERGEQYWRSMTRIYQECYRVLRPGGLLALCLKGYTRTGEYVDLPRHTAGLVQSLGFLPYDHWRRELWALSFWRILQKRRDPEAFDNRLNYEEVLCFRKPA